MRNRSLCELFDYWNERRGRRPAPDRTEIEPGAIRRALADVFILSFEPRNGHPFRIAGTRVCALFGRELKAKAFLDLWSPQDRARIDALIAVTAEEAIGVLAGATFKPVVDTQVDASPDTSLALELLLLPLAYHGRTDARLIGALAPRTSPYPYWLGTCAPAYLDLMTHRFLGHAPAVSRSGEVVVLPAVPGRVRHGFVVYDGGSP